MKSKENLIMKSARMFCLIVVAGISAGAIAKGGSPTKAAPQAQASPQQPTTISSVVDAQISTVEREFVSAAEAMPEDKYNFTPTALNISGSDYKGVKTFAAQVKHVATVNYILWGM